MSWAGASSILILIVGVIIFMTVSRATQHNVTPINAEKFASDVVENPQQMRGNDSTSEPTITFLKGRMAIFAGAVLALVGALVTGVLAPFTSVSWWTPCLLLLISVGCLATLRALALSDARQRAESLATRRQVARPRRGQRPVKKPATSIKPHQLASYEPYVHGDNDRVYRPAPVSSSAKNLHYARTHRAVAEQLPHKETAHQRQEADNVSQEYASQTYVAYAHQQFEKAPEKSWTPVRIPTPTYLEAPVVYRDVDVTPLAEELSHPKAEDIHEGTEHGVVMNIDEVLNRRRA